MLKDFLKFITIFLIGLGTGIFFAEQVLLEQGLVYVTERKEIFIQENVALERAVEKVEKTVIRVQTKVLEDAEVLEGNGLILSSDGLIVTLADLVPWGNDFSFFLEGKAVAYQILKRDLKNNLALIKINKENLKTVRFADFEKTRLGKRVFLAGFDSENGLIVNQGLVRRFSEDIIETNIFETDFLAGSPLFDIEGQVLGLCFINLEGRVLAVPISKIKTLAGF